MRQDIDLSRRMMSTNYALCVVVLLCLCNFRNVSATNTLSAVSSNYPAGAKEIEVVVTLDNEDAVCVQFDLHDTPNVLSGDSVYSPLEDDNFIIVGNDSGVAYRVISLSLSLDEIPFGSNRIMCVINYTVESSFDGVVELDFTGVELIDGHKNVLAWIIHKINANSA